MLGCREAYLFVDRSKPGKEKSCLSILCHRGLLSHADVFQPHALDNVVRCCCHLGNLTLQQRRFMQQNANTAGGDAAVERGPQPLEEATRRIHEARTNASILGSPTSSHQPSRISGSMNATHPDSQRPSPGSQAVYLAYQQLSGRAMHSTRYATRGNYTRTFHTP